MNERDRQLVSTYAGSRIAIGLAMMLFPSKVFRPLLGDAARTPAARMLGRLVGARDALLGLGAIVAVQDKEPVRRWMTYGAAADAIDALSILAAYRSLPPRRRFVTLIAALGGTATGISLAARLD